MERRRCNRPAALRYALSLLILTGQRGISNVRSVMLSKFGAVAPLCWVFVNFSVAVAQSQLAIAPSEGVLVLRNGYVLTGHITPQGDFYLVTFGNSSEARMPADQVELVCRNIEEAYFIKRDRVLRTDIKARFQLADWCLRHQLYARAADQILCCLALDPEHPRITTLRRRLVNLSSPANRPATVAPVKTPTMTDDRPADAAAELPPGAVKQFTEAVQPVLLNRCATNACHGAGGDSQLGLIRPRPGRILTHRMTQRNLRATLNFVDRKAPAKSPLLTAPVRPHGGLAGPVFGPNSNGPMTALAEWVFRVAGTAGSERQQRVVGRNALRGSAANWPHVNQEPPGGPQGDANAPADTRPVRSASVPSRDPFDPDIFNRRHQ